MHYTIRKLNRNNRTLTREGFIQKIKDKFLTKKKNNTNGKLTVSMLRDTFLIDSWLDKQELPTENITVTGLDNLLIDGIKKQIDVSIYDDYKVTLSFIDKYVSEYSKYKALIDKEYLATAKAVTSIYKDASNDDEWLNYIKSAELFIALQKKLDAVNPRNKVFGSGVKFLGNLVIKPNSSGDGFDVTKKDMVDTITPLPRDKLQKLAEFLVKNERDILETSDRVWSAIPGINYDDDIPGVDLWWDDMNDVEFFYDYYHQRFWNSDLPEPLIDFPDKYIDSMLKLLYAHAKFD